MNIDVENVITKVVQMVGPQLEHKLRVTFFFLTNSEQLTKIKVHSYGHIYPIEHSVVFLCCVK